MKEFKHFINGEYVASASGKHLKIDRQWTIA